jgi:hypothetical protein
MLTLGIKWTARTRGTIDLSLLLVVTHTRGGVNNRVSTKYRPLLDVSQFYLNYVTNYIFLFNLAITTR